MGSNQRSEFLRLFLPIHGDLLGYILSMGIEMNTAEDILQDASVAMWENMDKFRPGTNFRAWAYTIVRNELRDALRKGSRRTLTLTPETYHRIEQLAASEDAGAGVRESVLLQCMSKLSEKARGLLLMRYEEEKSLPEIARDLARPLASIYTTLSRIRKYLRDCINRAVAVEEANL